MEVSASLVTATGARPAAFRLCSQFVARFAKPGTNLQWIVVDDAFPESPVVAPPNVELTVVRPQPYWRLGENTLARNLLAGLEEVRRDWIFFIEDDDWYGADYLENMLGFLLRENRQIVGEVPALYYNVATRQYKRLSNLHHASLCQTAIHRDLLPVFTDVCKEKAPDHGFLDMHLWERAPAHLKWTFCPARLSSIGIKGLPGRDGIGAGHRPSEDWNADPDLGYLGSRIGEDAELYRGFLGGEEMEPEFETFLWKGQRRYRCPHTWEGGARCEYDSYDADALRLHAAQPHTLDGKPSPRPTVTVGSPLVDSEGKQIVYEKPNPRFQKASFKKE